MVTQGEATRIDLLGRDAALTSDVIAYISSRLKWASSVYEDDSYGCRAPISLASPAKLTTRCSDNSKVFDALMWCSIGAVSAITVLYTTGWHSQTI